MQVRTDVTPWKTKSIFHNSQPVTYGGCHVKHRCFLAFPAHASHTLRFEYEQRLWKVEAAMAFVSVQNSKRKAATATGERIPLCVRPREKSMARAPDAVSHLRDDGHGPAVRSRPAQAQRCRHATTWTPAARDLPAACCGLPQPSPLRKVWASRRHVAREEGAVPPA